GRDMGSTPDYSDEIAREIDDEIRRIVEDAHQRATDILNEHREALDTISEILIRRETIERDEFLALLDGRREEDVFDDEPPASSGLPAAAEDEVSSQDRSAPRPLPRPGLGTAMDAGDGVR